MGKALVNCIEDAVFIVVLVTKTLKSSSHFGARPSIIEIIIVNQCVSKSGVIAFDILVESISVQVHVFVVCVHQSFPEIKEYKERGDEKQNNNSYYNDGPR